MGKQSTIKKYSSAFTIVEIIVVITALAVLVSIATVGFVKYQQQSRDDQRSTKVSDIVEALEAYYLKNGDYPVCSSFSTNPRSVLDIKNGESVITPTAPSGATSSIVCTALLQSASNDNFAYMGGGCTTNYCTSYSIQYRQEYDKTIKSVDSRHLVTTTTPCPSGFITVPGNTALGTNNFCVMKYEAKNQNGTPTSIAATTPWSQISQTQALNVSQLACGGCHLITEAEWMTIAANVASVPSNWTGGSVGNGYLYQGYVRVIGTEIYGFPASPNDADGLYKLTSGTGSSAGYNSRRTLTLTNGQIIWDFSGNVGEWTQGSIPINKTPKKPITGTSCTTTTSGTYQWNDSAIDWNGFPTSSRPSFLASQPGLGSIGSWSSTQGIGKLFTICQNNPTNLSYVYSRGGSLYNTDFAGIFSLNVGETNDNNENTSFGFRVAR